MFATSAENIVSDDGQDNDNQGNQPCAAATRLGSVEWVVWIRHKKSSSVDERYQSTAINAQSLNGFHARVGKRQKHGNPIPSLPCDSVDNTYSIAGFAEILDWGPFHPDSIGMELCLSFGHDPF
jgi:hypothetical protein